MKLNFTNKHSGFKYIKTVEALNLVPLQYIKGDEEKSSISPVQTMDCPVFYNVKADKFSIFLPDDFLEKITLSEITKNFKSGVSVINEKGVDYAYLNYESLNDLRAVHQSKLTKASSFKDFADQYESHIADLDSGVPVIFMAFNAEMNPDLSNFTNNINAIVKQLGNSVMTRFEFFKAVKFNDKYYLMDNEDKINKEIFFDFKKGANSNMSYLILPFSEEDWNMANKINERVKTIRSSIESIFKKQQTSELFDIGFNDARNLIFLETNKESEITKKTKKP